MPLRRCLTQASEFARESRGSGAEHRLGTSSENSPFQPPVGHGPPFAELGEFRTTKRAVNKAGLPTRQIFFFSLLAMSPYEFVCPVLEMNLEMLRIDRRETERRSQVNLAFDTAQIAPGRAMRITDVEPSSCGFRF